MIISRAKKTHLLVLVLINKMIFEQKNKYSLEHYDVLLLIGKKGASFR